VHDSVNGTEHLSAELGPVGTNNRAPCNGPCKKECVHAIITTYRFLNHATLSPISYGAPKDSIAHKTLRLLRPRLCLAKKMAQGLAAS
jgi:hypothetical protein